MSIPADQIVKVIPQVVSAGGSALVMNGVMLTKSLEIPFGVLNWYAGSSSVGAACGLTSPEYNAAGVYFNGFTNSDALPGQMGLFRYADVALAAQIRGASLAAMTLSQLQALSGTLTITIDGTPVTSGNINLATATSFSNAATMIAAAFTGAKIPAVAFDSIQSCFVFSSPTTGASTSSMSYASGTLAAGLLLGQTNGAILSAGADADTPATAMQRLIKLSQNWVTFTTMWEPDTATKLAFAAWTVSQNKQFAYIAWDTDASPTTSSAATASFGYQVDAAKDDGVCPIWVPASVGVLRAAFVMGTTASIDFNATNGRITYAFKGQAGMVADVTDVDIYKNLIANGYNCVGQFATRNDGFVWFMPGSVAGQYEFLDSYINQIWLNNQFQLADMTLLGQVKSIPYNPDGYGLIRQADMDPISAAVNFGAIRNDVPLSAQQAALVNNAAGLPIDKTLSTQGWYLQILPASAQVRAARGTPPKKFWYMDGGSVQQITMNSILVQ